MFTTSQTSFSAGEISPSILGRTDLAKWHQGALTMRNMFVDYRGGSSSRAGLAYVGMCKQPGTSNPPRDIPFQFNINQGYVLEFGDQYMRIKSQGAYVVEASKNITGATQASPAVLTINAHGYSVGDWIYITGMGGMTNFNGLTWIVNTVPTANTLTLTDLFGSVVNSSGYNAYTSGGTAARIYTVVAPYAAIDLPYLKYTQSADTMTLCCLNQDTLTEYKPYELVRSGATNWAFTPVSFGAAILPPSNVSVTANSSTTVDTYYRYVVTSINENGEESVASASASVQNNNISIYAGSNTITWSAVTGAIRYNVYKATPSYNVDVPVSSQFGFCGVSYGGSFSDDNITADFTIVPPVHSDPFARGTIDRVTITAGGAGYTQATVGYTITTAGGTGYSLLPVVVSGAVVAVIVQNGGHSLLPGDTITFTDSGAGAGATGTLTIGPQTGTYPSVPAYYQQRRAYANTINNPNTYYFSKPGFYNNMDSSVPTIDSDAIVGTPWAQQINGIQFMVPMTSALVTLTGSGAWSVNGGNASALTPADQTAQSQAYNGCHNHIQPLVVNYDILYVQSKGSVVRDLSYNFFVNVFTGTDMTVLSSHLFSGFRIKQWAYAEEPYKIVWAVRDDGALLSFTYLKEQDVYGWARHDTNGLFQNVCVITEPPEYTIGTTQYIDAPYFIVKRYINGGWHYYSERMNNRIWNNVEECFCVDSGLSYPITYPNATLTMSAASGSVTATASSSVFSAANVGNVLRVGGGIGTVTSYVSGTQLLVSMTQSITATIPNNPQNMPIPAIPGTWGLSAPTSTVTGLNHLEGQTVSILADGSVVTSQTVVNGTITLPHACSAITVGLPYTCQLQNLYLDAPGHGDTTTQGKRKTIPAVTVRVKDSRGFSVGTNQPDASIQPNGNDVPWTGMKEVKERNALVHAGTAIPLFTGDVRVLVPSDWNTKGQVATQQTYPLPLNVMAYFPEHMMGDTSG
jgi:hypothetical protein